MSSVITHMTAPKKHSGVPDNLLVQINEHTAGGFVLISVDENGNAVVQQHFDVPIIKWGLERFCLEYFQNQDIRHTEMVAEQLSPKPAKSDDEDDEDWDAGFENA